LPLKYLPKNELCSVAAGVSHASAPEFAPSTLTSEDIARSLSNVPDGYKPQLEQSFDFWNSALLSGQSPELQSGMSIEQLLAEADPLDSMGSILDDQLMSTWMVAPTDVA
jgi:hypothetical protein